MIRSIIKDPVFLAKKAEDTVKTDLQIGNDLLETIMANKQNCAGMAANMIGFNKRIIGFVDESGQIRIMYNPQILSKRGPYETKERCLSLAGERTVKRFKMISVKYLDEDYNVRVKTYLGWTAQIIQHEIDHTNGILV